MQLHLLVIERRERDIGGQTDYTVTFERMEVWEDEGSDLPEKFYSRTGEKFWLSVSKEDFDKFVMDAVVSGPLTVREHHLAVL